MSLVAYLQRKTIPQDRPALIEAAENRIVSYGELWDQVDHLALGLCGLGLQPKDRVALMLPNSKAWILSFLAVLKAGGIVIPFRQSATSAELKRLLSYSKPLLLIGNSSFINRSLPFDLIEGIEQVVICSKRLMARVPVQRITSFDNLLEQEPEQRRQSIITTTTESQVASINYTYRGYGYSLGAMLTHGNYIHGIETYLQTTGLHEGQRCLLASPLSHTYPLIGCLLTPLAIGATVIIAGTLTVPNLWETIFRYHVNVLTGVPSLYAALLRSEGADLSNVEAGFCGGSLMPVSLYEEIRCRWHLSLRQGYGLTECLPVTCNPSWENRPETLGRVGVGVKVEIFGEDGREKPAGEIGEITVAGPTVMAGYYSMPRETSEVMKNGWFYTGDYGCFDTEGYLHFVGVKKRTAKVAGNMVDLTEVERELLAYPGIISARAYAIPDETWGEIIGADITCGGSELDAKAIRRYLKGRLTSYKVPRIQVSIV